ncbi:MAG: hypothetical protein VKL39_05500, partial [Leptolyngbyaceae bacterium]|nr:hypothetical protein [Leptolyngbyaceae bacterium]
LNYFGTRSEFQVYARRMGKSQEHIDQDLRSLSWFVSVTRPQLNHHDPKSRQRQLEIAQDLRRSRDFRRQRHWDLPDGSRLDLFQRKQLPIQVIPLDETPSPTGDDPSPIHLTHINVPSRSGVGESIPVTYSWQGSWDALTHGAVILTWQRDTEGAIAQPNRPQRSTQWLHDHFIGFGTLRPHPIQANQSMQSPAPETIASSFNVVERTAMQTPADVQPGLYQLKASYLDTRSGTTTPLTVPGVTLRIAASKPDEPKLNEPKNSRTIQFAVDTPDGQNAERRGAEQQETNNRPDLDRPEVDWVSQLRMLSTALPQGIEALDPVFDQIGRFSLYDPVQSYAQQAEVTLAHRLQINPNDLENAYALTLAQVLQRDAEGAIATLQSITALDSRNPYAHAYLAFVHLYALHPHAAHDAISRAIALDPDVQEFKLLRVVASVMGGDLWHAWSEGRAVFAT